MGANMERIMKAQALRDATMGTYMSSRKTLEINATNPIIDELRKRNDVDKTDKTLLDILMLLYDSALIASGFYLEAPSRFVNRLYRMIKLGLSIREEDKTTDVHSAPAVSEGDCVSA